MKKWTALLCVFFILSVTNFYAQAESSSIETIVFLRHGEKPFFDFGQLTCQGMNRALALPKLLVEKYGSPDYIFAPNPYWDGFYYYVRALITIEPTAISLNKPVQTDYQYFYDEAFSKELLLPKYHQSLLFVAWEHVYIVKIVKNIMVALNADPNLIPDWPETEYDSLYILKIDWRSTPPSVNFIHEKQHLNNQSDDCPVPATVKKFARKADNGKKTFIFIPNAESLNGNVDQLTCQGLNRAISLTQLLDDLYPDINCFVLPSASGRSPEETSKFNFLRTLMTIEPTIIYRGGLFIPASYKLSEAVQQIKSATAYKGTVAVTWPIEEMARIARTLYSTYGGNPNEIPNPVPNINTIYQITINYSSGAAKPEFLMISENLPNQATICPGPAHDG